MKKRFWTVGLGIIAAIAFAWGGQFLGISSIAQTSPTPQVTPTPVPTSTPSPQRVPVPVASPTVAPPEFSEPEPPPEPEPIEITVEVPLGEGTYSKADRFQIAILEGYEVTETAGIPLIESSDRHLAYTVLWKQQASNTLLPSSTLTQMAIDELEDGEGFQFQTIEASVPGAVLLSWSGTAKNVPVGGKVLVRQADDGVMMLVVAGTGDGIDRLDRAISALAETLKPLN